MASLNRVFLMGHLTRDPELKSPPSGQAVSTLALAVNSRWGSGADAKEEVLYIDVVVWGKVAENCVTYLKKGSPILVEGRLRTRSWDDKETGQKRSKMEVTATMVQFLPSGKGKPGDPAGAASNPPADDDVPF